MLSARQGLSRRTFRLPLRSSSSATLSAEANLNLPSNCFLRGLATTSSSGGSQDPVPATAATAATTRPGFFSPSNGDRFRRLNALSIRRSGDQPSSPQQTQPGCCLKTILGSLGAGGGSGWQLQRRGFGSSSTAAPPVSKGDSGEHVSRGARLGRALRPTTLQPSGHHETLPIATEGLGERRKSIRELSAGEMFFGSLNIQTVEQLLRAKPERPLQCVDNEATAQEAVKMMLDEDVGSLVVISHLLPEDGDGGSSTSGGGGGGGLGRITPSRVKAVGLVTKSDYIRQVTLENRDPHKVRVQDIMTPLSRLMCVRPDDTLERCLYLLSENRFGHLPVIAARKEAPKPAEESKTKKKKPQQVQQKEEKHNNWVDRLHDDDSPPPNERIVAMISAGDLIETVLDEAVERTDDLQRYIAGEYPR